MRGAVDNIKGFSDLKGRTDDAFVSEAVRR